jgi:TolB-like protein/Tfp pilus assembly protein PilF/tRNA A-37 threonylcarbamoyl transferase component Bud32
MIGRALRHYRIVDKIGAGGMGEVYRARDEHLNRDVAIKILPADALADDKARRLFRREAEALSKLNHPHIATVFDFDSQDGVDFIVMEHVTGESLDRQLETGALPEKTIARLGEQMASALEEAHEHGIIHRDLKPANVRLTPKGQAKILDFGIARLLQPAGVEATTESFADTQVLAGTLPYMSPEQLRGEAVDGRSDIYSLGVMLYEMATGQRPFQQKLSTALSDAILHQPAPTPRLVNSRLSPELERIILKCLEKDSDNRYQSAKELAVDLRRLGAPEAARAVDAPRKRLGRPALALMTVLIAAVLGTAGYFARQRFWPQASHPVGRIMLAVLPFDNLSGDPEQEYFSDGLTEEMISQLGSLQPERLGVIARTSAMYYKGTHKRLDEIGQELGVDYIVEGSVRREANRVRITAQLIQVSDQTQLWAESFERQLADVFVIQSEVAGRIARSLEVELLPSHQAQLASARGVDPEAHEAYLKGRYHLNKRTEADLKKALEYFQQAVATDPDYALGYAGLADCYYVAAARDFLPPAEAYREAETAARRALELDDQLAEAHTALAAVTASEYDWSDAEREYERAIELNPSYATAHHWYSLFLAAMGRHDEALAEIKLAHELDPLSLIINEALGWPFYLARQYDQAIEQYERTLEMEPNFTPTYYDLGRAYLHKGRLKDAIRVHRKLVELSGGQWNAKAALGHTYAVAGKQEAARKILSELVALSNRSYVSPYDIARIYAGLGDKDEALAWLEKAYQERNNYLIYLKVDPDFDPLRSDPRFDDLLHRLGFPP